MATEKMNFSLAFARTANPNPPFKFNTTTIMNMTVEYHLESFIGYHTDTGTIDFYGHKYDDGWKIASFTEHMPDLESPENYDGDPMHIFPAPVDKLKYKFVIIYMLEINIDRIVFKTLIGDFRVALKNKRDTYAKLCFYSVGKNIELSEYQKFFDGNFAETDKIKTADEAI